MFVNLVYNEVTQKFETSYPSSGAVNPLVTETGTQTLSNKALAGILTTSVDNIITTSTDGLVVQNTTSATAGVTVQITPRIVWAGTAYNSVSTLSETRRWWWEGVPVTAAGTTAGAFNLKTNLNGGAAVQIASINEAGTLTVPQGITLGSLSSLSFSGAGYLTGGSATGLFLLRNLAATTGVGFDVATDAVFKIRTRAQSAYATVDALGYSVGGVAGATGTFASVTVVNGIVTSGT